MVVVENVKVDFNVYKVILIYYKECNSQSHFQCYRIQSQFSDVAIGEDISKSKETMKHNFDNFISAINCLINNFTWTWATSTTSLHHYNEHPVKYPETYGREKFGIVLSFVLVLWNFQIEIEILRVPATRFRMYSSFDKLQSDTFC